MGEVHRLPAPQISFTLQAAGRLMTEILPPWVQDLALLVESIETVQPPGALPDWQPGRPCGCPTPKSFAAMARCYAPRR